MVVAKDVHQLQVSTADFLFDADGMFYIVTCDVDGVIRLLDYDPDGTEALCQVHRMLTLFIRSRI